MEELQNKHLIACDGSDTRNQEKRGSSDVFFPGEACYRERTGSQSTPHKKREVESRVRAFCPPTTQVNSKGLFLSLIPRPSP
jgi:predicted glycosyl hydrolase (DUF1957 family)